MGEEGISFSVQSMVRRPGTCKQSPTSLSTLLSKLNSNSLNPHAPQKEKDTKAEAEQGGKNWQKWNQGEQQKPGKILIKIGSVWTCYNETELMHANKNIQTENLNYTYGITCVWTCVYLQYWTHHQKSSHVSWRYLPGFNPQQRQRERPLHRAGPGPGGCTGEVIWQLH